MRKVLVMVVVLAGFTGLVGIGAMTALLSGTGNKPGWSDCSSRLGPWGAGEGEGKRDASTLNEESLRITQRIIEIGKERGMPPRAWQIAIQAGKTESNLANLSHGHADSLGIFQMRPSMGWGSVSQVTDVDYQINKFFDVLEEVPGWEDMRPGTAAQRVERSAFPQRYHKWEPMAAHLVSVRGEVQGFSGCEDMSGTGASASNAISYADDQIGSPYVWGATGPDTFDCSGLTQQAWKAAGVNIPRTSKVQYQFGGERLPLAEARPGDLVFWGSGRDPKAIHHVALYLGDNEILHAPQKGETVERSKMWDGGELMPMVVRPAGSEQDRAEATSEAPGPDSPASDGSASGSDPQPAGSEPQPSSGAAG
ncbi:C40 family peptidase [Parasphingorhabdus pacifica]